MPDKFENLFEKISKKLVLSLISENSKIDKIGELSKNKPIWNFLDNYDGSNIFLDNGEVVKLNNLKKRPLRILFFIYISEMESRLFRLTKINFPEIPNILMDRLNLIDLIKLFKDKYNNKKLIKKLNSINNFRNKIMHMDSKFEKELKVRKLKDYKNDLIYVNNSLQELINKKKLNNG